MASSTNNLGIYEVDVGIRLEVHECGTCGVLFGMSIGFANNRRNDHQAWYCPNGHSLVAKEWKAKVLQREIDRLKQDATRLGDERRAAEVEAAELKTANFKLMRRIGAGTCPCCKRTFSDVRRHMKTKHPNIVPIGSKALT